MAASDSRSSAPPGGPQARLEGRVLGDRYRVLSRLGEGGMGTVYLCEHAVLHRRFAVKVLRSDLAADPELVDRFRNEAIAASRIGVENVVDVVDFGTEQDGALYYVMEALDGRSLGAVIRDEGPLAIPRALALLEQICRALAAAHARGVVHRDVKPDNVFIVRRENGTELAKVIDFGISHVPPAKGSGRITRAGSIIGTPEYMAPEQAAGAAPDRRIDVYAAGVLAFEMLTGELPIEAATPAATLAAHRTRNPDPPSRRRSSIPPEVDALVLRALAKRPEDRFESMDALAAAIARVRVGLAAKTPSRRSPRGETIALSAGSVERERWSGVRERRGIAVMVAAFAVAAAILALGWFVAAPSIPDAISTARPTHPVQTAAVRPEPLHSGHPERSGGEAPAEPKGAEASARDRRAATPTPTATSTSGDEGATLIAPVPAPVLIDERPAFRSSPAREERPSKGARRAPQPPAGEQPSPDDLKDPYAGAAALKDPFR